MKNQHLKICSNIIEKTRHKHPYVLDNPNKIHYSFLFEGIKLVSYGVNYTIKNIHPTRMTRYKIQNVNVHSEANCLTGVNLNNLTFSQIILVNFRVNKAGNYLQSMPCERCQSFISKVGLISKLWHTTSSGEIIKWKL